MRWPMSSLAGSAAQLLLCVDQACGLRLQGHGVAPGLLVDGAHARAGAVSGHGQLEAAVQQCQHRAFVAHLRIQIQHRLSVAGLRCPNVPRS